MNIDEQYEKMINSKYVNGKKYLINIEKKDNYILIYIEDNFYLYQKKLQLEDFTNHRDNQIKSIDDAMDLLVSNKNISELKKLKNCFLYTLTINLLLFGHNF